MVEISKNQVDLAKQEFKRYKEIIVDRMKTTRYQKDTAKISQLFFKAPHNFDELTDEFPYSDNIIKEKV